MPLIVETQLQALAESLFDELNTMFTAISQGLDIAPAAHYRLEGQFQLLLSLNAFTWQGFVSRCESGLKQHGLNAPDYNYWAWCFNGGDVYLRLPLVMREAPVYR